MNLFVKELTQIIGALSEASAKIEAVDNPEMHLLKNKIVLDLKRHIDALKLQLGIDPGVASGQLQIATPLTRMFGKDLTASNNILVDVNKPFSQTPQDVAETELQLKADELYPRFLSTPSDHLLDSVTDIEIRAVAKKVGLPVTETSPSKITTGYIDQIKAAIQQQNSAPPFEEQKQLTKEDEELALIQILYAEFDSLENALLISDYPDIHIRAVAKIAGLPVTETSPSKIDGKFINQVKAAIKKKAELEAAGNKV